MLVNRVKVEKAGDGLIERANRFPYFRTGKFLNDEN